MRLYSLPESRSSWKQVSSSRANHSALLKSAVIHGREILRARSESRRKALMPKGTAVIFAGGHTKQADTKDTKMFANNVWATLDKVFDVVPEMVLVHGGYGKGADGLAASWAERRGVAQLTCSLDRKLGARAGYSLSPAWDAFDPA